MQQFPLSTGWQLKQRDPQCALADDFATTDGWLTTTVPGSVFHTLLAHGRIPDPFVGENERAVQSVGEADWLYRCTFDLAATTMDVPHVDLCLDGLDTFATVWLNGAQLFSGDNMFVPQRISIVQHARPVQNELRVLFESALLRGRAREAAGSTNAFWNGESSRLYVRKAPYHYGWDWGPTLLDAGVWREVRIESYDARIADIHCPAVVAPDLASATLPVYVQIANPAAARSLQLTLHAPDGTTIKQASLPVEGEHITHTFTLDNPQLWWPHTLGTQPLYQISAALATDNKQQTTDTRTLGLRRISIVQEPVAGEEGTSFHFEINNTPLFVGGANWIPDDIPTVRITPERYQSQVRLAVEANMSMLRVWGGGIYEDAAFYQACDEQGVLVWQDFLFACGVYPTPAYLLASVRAEAAAQVKRLRHHVCIALWCGNNEDYSIAASNYRPDLPPEQNHEMPARMIYERLLPEVCAVEDGTRPYWPGSPYGGSWSDDPNIGDRHVWNVWHGDMQPYQEYPQLAGRFVSEFGMAAFPALATIQAFAPQASAPDDAVIQFHQKASEGHMRITHYMATNTGVPADLPGFIYASQLVQAEALTAAYVGWRRRWGVAGKRATGGALVWQLNDDWPTMSWAIVDYFQRPKAGYYAVKRALAPLAVGVCRADGQAEIWVVNGTVEAVATELELAVWALDGQQRAQQRQQVVLAPNSVTELGAWPNGLADDEALAARLFVGGTVVARFAAWHEPLKNAHLRQPEIVLEAAADAVRLSAVRPAKGIWLDAGDGVTWDDNGFDMMPGETRTISAAGLGSAAVRLRSYIRSVNAR